MRNTLLFALAMGAAAALCSMLTVFGVPGEAFGEDYFGLTMLALAFTLSLVAAGASFLIRAARPGNLGRAPLILIGLLFLAAMSAAMVALMRAHPAAWIGMIFGPQWAACLICIPLFAIVPFASLVWALRKEAPTRLRWTGAVTGLVAGALGAAAFSFHHPGGSIPFIVLWYGGPIVVCALSGRCSDHGFCDGDPRRSSLGEELELPARVGGGFADSGAGGCLADANLKTATFHDALVHGKLIHMKLRLLAHCLALALFVTASVLTAFVSPAKAGYGCMDVKATMPMAADMPCCPPDQGKAKDCMTNCPALSFCVAKGFTSEPMAFVTLAQPVVVELGLVGNDAVRAPRPFEPPARPPRI